MSLDELLQFVPVFVLVFFRLAGLMIFAPLLGSSRVPRRVKLMLALVLALGLVGSVQAPVALPASPWELAVGIGGEIVFGIAMGMILSFVFIAAQWSGELISQQMGLNMSEVFDPQFGGASTIVGDLQFMLTLVVFLTVNGHHAMIRAIRASFEALPLLSVGMDRPTLDTLTDLLSSSTTLAVQLAAPMLVTMIVVDLVLGCLSKTMPQLNIMTAGLAIRSLVGMAVLVVGAALTGGVLEDAVKESMSFVEYSFVQRADPIDAGISPEAAPVGEAD